MVEQGAGAGSGAGAAEEEVSPSSIRHVLSLDSAGARAGAGDRESSSASGAQTSSGAGAGGGAAGGGTGGTDSCDGAGGGADGAGAAAQQQQEQQQGHRPSSADTVVESLEFKVERLVREADVVVFGRTWCPFLKDAVALLTEQMCVQTHLVETNVIPEGDLVVKYLQSKTEHPGGSPFVFIRGKFIGGCEELYELWKSGDLERDVLCGLIQRNRTTGTERIATSALAPCPRGEASMPFFLHPCAVNGHVTRVTALFVFALSAVNAAFYDRIWARYLSTAIAVDALSRLLVGPSLSSLGMLSTLMTIMATPSYVPGPAKQIDALIGTCISILSTVFFFVPFDGHSIIGCIGMCLLAVQGALEGFLNVSLGSLCVELGIHLGIFSDHIYRMYNSTLLETIETENYRTNRQTSPRPVRINADRSDPIALRYKRKSDEWIHADFDPIRHMHVHYFMCPLSLAGLAMAFRVGSRRQYPDNFKEVRASIVNPAWFQVIASIAAFCFVFMCFMYLTKGLLFHRKVSKEMNGVVSSPGFAAITITCMIFGFLCYNRIFDSSDRFETPAEVLGRVFFWIGSVTHALFTIKSVGEWIGRRLDLEHVHAYWVIFPVGFGVAAFCSPVVGPFSNTNPNSIANESISNFYYSFGVLLWIVSFTVTFLQVVTSHNTDMTKRHGIWFWVACPNTLGYAAISKCVGAGGNPTVCFDDVEPYYFVSIVLFLVLIYASTPHIGFLGRDEFTMAYWIDCFALDTLAMGSGLFYLTNGWEIGGVLEFVFLTIASLGNLIAMLHTLVHLIRKDNVATPQAKLHPLSFNKLTRDAIRACLPTLQYYLQIIDLDSDSREARENLGLFAAHFNEFRIVQEEHMSHEQDAIYKVCSDFFPDHGRKFIMDHRDDRALLIDWCELADIVLDSRHQLLERKEALDRLRSELPPFFSHLIRHFTGEQQNIDPIVRKYFSVELKKQVARDVWTVTPAARWEVIVPFVLVNLPRHSQRVTFLRSLLWSMPERAQQVGAIVYRHVDAVMWERLRYDVREIIPRGAPEWVRYH